MHLVGDRERRRPLGARLEPRRGLLLHGVHVVGVERADAGGQHDGRAAVERRQDPFGLVRAGPGQERLGLKHVARVGEKPGELLAEVPVVLHHLERRLDEDRHALGLDVRRGERRRVVGHLGELLVPGRLDAVRCDALPLARGDRNHAGELAHRVERAVGRQHDARVERERDSRSAGRRVADRHRASVLSLDRGPVGAHLGVGREVAPVVRP